MALFPFSARVAGSREEVGCARAEGPVDSQRGVALRQGVHPVEVGQGEDAVEQVSRRPLS